MVGIVIVSHSAKLAAGVQELAQQMGGTVPLAIAAGIDDPENPLGTDATQVYQAISSVYSDAGVVVLMDLGSAVLSAEMALEFLSDQQRQNVKLCAAPLVEGTIAAVVQAANGANLEQVIAEASGALAAKASQFSGVVGVSVVEAQYHHETQPIPEIYLTVQNAMGLHARPAAKLVATASQFESDITIRNATSGREAVNAKSINQVITLAVRQGQEIAIAALGVDATAALDALQHLVEANFGETAALELPPPPTTSSTKDEAGITLLLGIPASPGIAMGTVVKYQPTVSSITQQPTDHPEQEWQQLQIACSFAREQIQYLCQTTATHGQEEAAIFEAHLLFLDDPAILENARQLIFVKRWNAAVAWQTAIDEIIAAYQNLQDADFQGRAADVFDVGQRVLQLLTGTQITPLELHEPAILIAHDLTPSQTAQLDPNMVLGICTAVGGVMSHSGILARSLGIPAVVGVGADVLQLDNGTFLALDGETGQVWLQLDETQLHQLQVKHNQQLAARQEQHITAQQPALTQDGYHVKVMANITKVTDAQVALDHGAEGVGLLRSEFLYLNRTSAPSEAEQLDAYQAIASTISPHPLIIRTLDIGGDKALPYLNLPHEANPFLGWRGIRWLLDNPDLLKTQLKAILRASYGYPIKVMFPMVASVREIRAAKAILAMAQTELCQAGILFNSALQVGIMIEVPAAVAIADQLAAEVDFFSIGTNDLSQYVMASDRNNTKVSTLADAFEPAVLRMIQQTVKTAHEKGIWVGVCGELAASPLATPILVGLGVDELSMNASAIPAVKKAISQFTRSEFEAIAFTMLQLDSAEAVKQYVAAW